MPAYIERIVYEPDHRPGSDFIVCGSYHVNVVSVDCPAIVAGISCFCIYRFNDVISSVQRLVPDELYLSRSVAELLHCKYCNILVFVPVQCGTQYYSMNILVGIVSYCYIINQVVAVKVEVVDMCIFSIEVSLKGFKRFRFLEKFHDRVEIKIIPWQAEVFLRIVLCPDCCH